jgi:ABC-type sugar transport system ATPase subunit
MFHPPPGAPSMAKVVLANLVKIFPEKSGPGVRAVNDVSLTIEDREFMVLEIGRAHV